MIKLIKKNRRWMKISKKNTKRKQKKARKIVKWKPLRITSLLTLFIRIRSHKKTFRNLNIKNQ
jgi:hypothetical protein